MYYILQIISSQYLQTPIPPDILGPYASFDEAWETAHKRCRELVEGHQTPDLVMAQNKDSGTVSVITKEVRSEFFVISLDSVMRLSGYQNVYGDILFRDDKRRLDVYKNPSDYIYSYDGIRWAQCPVDLGKISYERCLYRKRPENITVGVTTRIRQNRKLFSYSTDNGCTWTRIPDGNDGDWIYHGLHSYTWFKEVTPQEVCEALLDAGWVIFPRKDKKTCVLQRLHPSDGSLIDQVSIPMTRALSDYDEAMATAISKLK